MRLIAHLSDLHFGRHDPRIVEGLLASIASARPDLVIVSGDLTQRARRAEFVEARRFLDRIGAPRVVIPGNHDIPLYGLFERFVSPFGAYKRHVADAGVPYCTYIDDEIAVLGINTVRRSKWKEGRISLSQMARIQSTLGHLPSNVLKIVVTHHPIAATEAASRSSLVARSGLAMRAITNARVHLMLSGHHHFAVSGEGRFDLALQHSVLAIYAGTAVSTRTRSGHKNSYNLIRLQPPRLSVDIMEWRSDAGFEPSGGAHYALENGHWKTGAPR
jgi:3',5'-cyclic AMP phosphodiesterase CpdA